MASSCSNMLSAVDYFGLSATLGGAGGLVRFLLSRWASSWAGPSSWLFLIFHCSTANAKSPSDPDLLVIIMCCPSCIFWTLKGYNPSLWFYHSSLYRIIIWLWGALWAPPWRKLAFWAPRLKVILFCSRLSTEAVCSWAGNPGIDCCLGLIPIGLLCLLPVPFTEPGLSLEPTM